MLGAGAKSPVSAPASVDVAIEPVHLFGTVEYGELFAESDATGFQHPLWLDEFYRRLVPERDAEPCIVSGRDRDSGALVFLLPMIRRTKGGITLLESCDLGVGDYAAPVVRRPLPHDLTPEVASVLPPFDLLRIRPVREEHVRAWQGFFSAPAVRTDFSAHAVNLDIPFAEWRARSYAPGFRGMLDRKKKRFFKTPGAEVRLLDNPAEIATAIAVIARLRAGRFERDPIQADFVRDFYAAVAARGHDAGLARTYGIFLAGEPIGYAFGITDRGRFAYLLIGCDYAVHGRHSPGHLLYDAMIADWAASGGKVFDFTIGDEPFKAEFGCRATAMYEVTIPATLRGRLGAAFIAVRRRYRGHPLAKEE